ncbi:hypothetical protein A4R26_23155 [Niastella populi]|uniref:FecR protein domain-containing protein n=1 Tax=Niastella populi TaxID=550983 RepID=A0A1V9FI30_9BACT|nr:hypothetical protein A4R26_23155 [Niastella populi]
MQQYLAGECTEEEEMLVLEWYKSLTANSDLHLSPTERSLIEARLWQTIKSNVADQPAMQPARVKPITARNWFRTTAAAAVVTLIVTAIVLYRQPSGKNNQLTMVLPQVGYDSLVNSTGTERKFMLGDSTLITLQPGAVIYYPAAFTLSTRDVYLHGSAFFNVHHNPQKHFKVHMNNELTTEVLGTSFNITQNKTDWNVEVAVVTGKVLVYRGAQDDNAEANSTGRVLLTRNKKVTFNAELNQLITSIVDNPLPRPDSKIQAGAGSQPIKQQFVFEEASLLNVLQTLSDAYGIMITTNNAQIAEYHFTGDLSKYSLFTQLDIICKSTQTTYEINGSQIIVKENQNQ